ncbi:MAG: uracil-DNA glycosylase [Spirochaetota bacterium]|nr:uracil-DNA glycosylase [Spirochaetota bacterium]
MSDQLNLWEKNNSPLISNVTFDEIIKSSSINEFKSKLRNFHCTRCPLSSEIQQNPTTSRGNPNSKIMLVGEAPGHNEMIQGIPFVGRAGQLMDKIFESINLSTEKDVYITNICRCRPVDNRTPLASEAKTCILYLNREIKLIEPQFILTLGATSAKYLLGNIVSSKPMQDIVGKFFTSDEYPNVKFFILYHPAALLYNPNLKIPMQEHMKLLNEHLH